MKECFVLFHQSDIPLDDSKGMFTYLPVVLAVLCCVKGLERMRCINGKAEEKTETENERGGQRIIELR